MPSSLSIRRKRRTPIRTVAHVLREATRTRWGYDVVNMHMYMLLFFQMLLLLYLRMLFRMCKCRWRCWRACLVDVRERLA